MLEINFIKMSGAGNDFIVFDNREKTIDKYLTKIVSTLCDKANKTTKGADGVILIEKSEVADFKMRIINSNGTEAEMCGNGARCAAYFAYDQKIIASPDMKFETLAGIIEASVNAPVESIATPKIEPKQKKSKDKKNQKNKPSEVKIETINVRDVKLKMTNPIDLKMDIKLKILGKNYHIDFINTGVPHAVVFVDDIKNIDVQKIGEKIRNDKYFKHGTNVNFVKPVDHKTIKVRTYERGVEAETLACGTGSVASSIISVLKDKVDLIDNIDVITKSKEIIKVDFRILSGRETIIKDVFMQGPVKIEFRDKIFL